MPWLSLDRVVRAILVVGVVVEELVANRPVSIADHEGERVWGLLSRVHQPHAKLDRQVRGTGHLYLTRQSSVVHQVHVENPLKLPHVRRDGELGLVRLDRVDAGIELRVVLKPVRSHEAVVVSYWKHP